MADLGGIFSKGSTAEQFLIWGVLQQMLGPLLLPLENELQAIAYGLAPDVRISPESAASAAARALISPDKGDSEAQWSGIDPDRFAILYNLATRAPDLTTVAEALRRKIIGEGTSGTNDTSFRGALTDAGIREDWHDVIRKLVTSIPDQSQVLNAWLEGQIEEGEARQRLLEAGMAEDWIKTAYAANGQAPTPMQALELLNRGIIPEGGTGQDATSYEQAFLEGPWRNKWLKSFIALRWYLPPPRTVTAMFHGGQLTHDEAAELLVKQGLTTDLAAKYLAPTRKTSAAKELTKAEIIALYENRVTSRAQALKSLQQLGYDDGDAGELLALADLKAHAAQVSSAVTRVRTLFLAGKLTAPQATTTLDKLGVTPEQASALINVWQIEHARDPKVLTPAQVLAGWEYGVVTMPDAIGQLTAYGYSDDDAYLLLAIKNKGPLPSRHEGQAGGPVNSKGQVDLG